MIFVAGCRIWFPDQGWNLDLWFWEHGVLAIGPSGKFQHTETLFKLVKPS